MAQTAATAGHLFENALAVGKTIDLSGCVYGVPDWDGPFANVTVDYYRFLAGLVRSQRLTSVAELGTHYGGSILAMRRGVAPDLQGQARFVTVDVIDFGNPALATAPMTCIVEDIFDRRTALMVARTFDGGVDLLFVDIVHGYHQTLLATAMYANQLRPRYIVLDDIRLNPGMRDLWEHIVTSGAGDAHDLSTLCNREEAGFGLIACRYPHRWDETGRWRIPLWDLRRRVSSRLPHTVKGKIRGALERMPGAARRFIDPS